MRKTALTLCLGMVLASSASASCFEEAASRYQVPVELLQAIARVESGGNPYARNINADGTEDVGLMQINSRWFPVLARYGISREHLFDACLNTHVGAWILAQNFHRLGYGWDAVGAYNAASPNKRLVYAKKIARLLYKKPNPVENNQGH